MLNLNTINSAKLIKEPFEFFTAENTISVDDLANIKKDFPDIRKPGIYPLSTLTYGDSFRKLIDSVNSKELRNIIENKFKVNLENLPLMVTVRGHCQQKDGRIHSDSKDKVITCLLYLNDNWQEGGGRLRLLRNSSDIDNYVAEIPPGGGSFAAFKVTPNSWHGHKPFVGERRYIMFNWVQSDDTLNKQLARHKLSAFFKKIFPFFYKGY